MRKPKGMFSRFSYVDVHSWTELLHEGEVLEVYHFDQVNSARRMRNALEQIRAGMARDERIQSVRIEVASPVDQTRLGSKLYTRVE